MIASNIVCNCYNVLRCTSKQKDNLEKFSFIPNYKQFRGILMYSGSWGINTLNFDCFLIKNVYLLLPFPHPDTPHDDMLYLYSLCWSISLKTFYPGPLDLHRISLWPYRVFLDPMKYKKTKYNMISVIITAAIFVYTLNVGKYEGYICV